jgi:SAM-dependent methyltransferase
VLSTKRGDARRSCAICQSETHDIGTVYGRYKKRYYNLARCAECGFAFVTNPRQDAASPYDDAYYDGRGADPLIDYVYELDHPDRTIRHYEWRGIGQVVKDLVGELLSLRWLDYGCGNGGLVRYLQNHHAVAALGFEEGWIARCATQSGIPILARSDLADYDGSFDVVSAIEVLEHTQDPVVELRAMRRLLRPGGLLFLTTGNARPHAAHLLSWGYVMPEIHISFFEPRTLERALLAAGFRPEYRRLTPGFDEILMFKVLKNLHVRRRTPLTDALPRRIVGAMADRLTHLSEHPVGWVTEHPDLPGPHSRRVDETG